MITNRDGLIAFFVKKKLSELKITKKALHNRQKMLDREELRS